MRYNGTTGAFIDAFVTAASGGLDLPRGLAFGPDGNLYVSSGDTNEVLRYNGATGLFIGVFVAAGSGGLASPGGLAFGPDNNLYVSSALTDQVLRYNGTTGAFIDVFVAAGSGGLDLPRGLVFGPDGNLYVSSFSTNQVLRYNGATGAFIDVFVAAGSGGLNGPVGLVFGPDNNLYVSSALTDQVLRYNGTTGQVLRYNGTTDAFIDAFVAAGSGGLSAPTGLAFGPYNNLYVSSLFTQQVLRYQGPPVAVPGNTAPVANPDSYSTRVNTPLAVAASTGVLANDTDADGDSLTAKLVSGPINGNLVLAADGAMSYTPDAGFAAGGNETSRFLGTDTFTYRANDGADDSVTTTVTIRVASNNAPVADPDSYTTREATTLTVGVNTGVLANDTDADGDALTANLVSGPANGMLALTDDGSFTYTPNAGFTAGGNQTTRFFGTDTFTYKANDGIDDSDTTTVTLTVVPNSAPVATNDTYTATANTALTVPAATGVLANDTDSEGDTLTALLVGGGPSNGTLGLGTDGGFTYTPNTGFSGTDAFTYKANDGLDDSNNATVTISVSPVASNDAYSTVQFDPLVQNGVLDNDSGIGLTASLVTSTANGNLSLSSDGTFTYTPTGSFTGTDSFTYQAVSAGVASNTATATITVVACSTGIGSTTASVSFQATSVSVAVSSNGNNCPWSASSNRSWIQVLSAARAIDATGPGRVTLAVQKNPRSVARRGTATIAGEAFTVNQRAARCTFAPSMITQSFTPAGGAGSFRVDTLAGCDWTPSPDAGWVQILNARTGDGQVLYTVDSNDGPKRRTKIRFGNRFHNVVQLGAGAANRPAPPKRLQLAVRNSGAVRVKWRDQANNETGYVLVRDDVVWMLAADREMYLDTEAVAGAVNCYTLQSFNDAGASGPVMACIQVPATRSAEARAANMPEGPHYITEPARRVVVDAEAGTLPTVPRARIYKAYEPWGEATVEQSLQARGYIRGVSLFVHPPQDMRDGIPEGTQIVLIPTASAGDDLGQVSAVSSEAAQRALRRFVRRGGDVVLHRWSDRDEAYRMPVGGAPSRSVRGYEVYEPRSESEAGAGAAYATDRPVDHPVAGPLGRLLERLLDRLAR